MADALFPEKPRFSVKLPPDDYRRGGKAQFIEAYSQDLNLSVIAIRGTDLGRFSDFIEDVKLYTEPVVFMILSALFPTIRMWADSTSSYIIEWLHETQALVGLHKKPDYYHSLVAYIRSIKGRNIVLAGHSLGGGLARIVGSLEGKASVAFSPPGIGQSYRKYHTTTEYSQGDSSDQSLSCSSNPQDAQSSSGTCNKRLQRGDLFHQSVAVVPDHDPISMVDTQVGLVQHIMCSSSRLAIQNACHMIEGTLCELLSHCGDPRGRFTGCTYRYNVGALLPFVWNFLDDYFYWMLPGLGILLILGGSVLLPEI
eukprot:CAMPEP_0113951972 /NCGR_PEP_ID=MMETSP1339-20121228/89015_1 /TAXON_ID=94617 /ORGANISM="Fibrocapsa japonica" /LENGTH=310 /DNA_ID=CAMNT_0000960429 /DNA_START=1 /DNA_END=933 /DNA_ORIENTATION=+ /assembly_acc=CAM_ASM_000762